MSDNRKNLVEKYKIVGLAFELGFIIALPLITFLLLGKYLDGRFNTNPFFKIAAVVLALTVTTVWLTRRFAEILSGMRQEDINHKNKNK